MYNIRFGDLFNILDRTCGSIIVFEEYDNRVLFDTAHNSVASKDLNNIQEMIVTQVTNYNGDEWRVYVKRA